MDGDTDTKPKRRARKKACEFDSLEKLKSIPKEEDVPKVVKSRPKATKSKVTKLSEIKPIEQVQEVQSEVQEIHSEEESVKHDTVSQSQISFGKFNITIKKKETMSADELREYYDKKFKIDDSEKTAKLMVQEDDADVIFEPLMEGDSVVKSGRKLTNVNSKPQKVTKPRSERINEHRLLSKFIDGVETEWPTKTNILCWWCCHKFDTVPLPCPVKYDEIKDGYKVNGVFCSWGCVAAYSMKEYASLTLVYQMRGTDDDELVIAPSRYCLKAFGGYMTIDAFRKLDKDKLIMISTEGLSYINTDIVEIKHG